MIKKKQVENKIYFLGEPGILYTLAELVYPVLYVE